uniref:Uncharacterized protein n=1 Tax=Oryza sativa subsp. japonica TaxID=39947 RepID=Q6EPV9_ORYSJ|nr:hypothetical protein [Oryza sativa Japonica Group]BAD29311.1 hypothetical protein [Oryza sativa Japonica Group]
MANWRDVCVVLWPIGRGIPTGSSTPEAQPLLARSRQKARHRHALLQSPHVVHQCVAYGASATRTEL